MDYLIRCFQEPMTACQKVEKCEKWLSENPGHDEARAVELIRKLEEEKVSLEEEKVSLEEVKVSLEEEKVSLETKLISRSLASLRTQYPCLRDHTCSGPYYPDKHNHADVLEIPVSGLAPSLFIKEKMDKPEFWEVPFVPITGKAGDCDSEIDSQILVVQILNAVLEGLHLSELISVVQNRTLAGAECDILLVYKPNRLPFSTVEVKKPGNSPGGRGLIWKGNPRGTATNEKGKTIETGGNRVAGEIFDQMRAIRLFGFQTVSGMISTGNQWRMVGLLDTCTKADTVNTAELLENLQLSTKGLEELLSIGRTSGEKIHTDDETNVDGAVVESPEQPSVDFYSKELIASEDQRKIWAGEIVPLDTEGMKTEQIYSKVKEAGPEIIAQVMHFALKACDDLVTFLHSRDRENPLGAIRIYKKMSCRILKNSPKNKSEEKRLDDVFSFGTVQVGHVNLDNFNPNLETIHVIHHLGMGDYGNVCLGVSAGGGSVCAIKFYHQRENPTREEAATGECENWNLIYGKEKIPKPFVLKVAGGHCLVMPYFYPIRKAERHHLLDNGAIETALIAFAKSGYIHNDINKWRHFGHWKLGDRENQQHSFIVLLDLGDIKKAENQAAIGTWICETMTHLRKSAGEKKSTGIAPKTPDPNPSKKRTLETRD